MTISPGLTQGSWFNSLKVQLEQPFTVVRTSSGFEPLSVPKSESNYVTNLRRSFLSQLQLDMNLLSNMIGPGQTFLEAEESSFLGKCPTSYTVRQLTDPEVTELKLKWKSEDRGPRPSYNERLLKFIQLHFIRNPRNCAKYLSAMKDTKFIALLGIILGLGTMGSLGK